MDIAASDKELWLFTMRFPFGLGEAFLEHELPILARRFKRIRCFPLVAEDHCRPVPGNVEVTVLYADLYASASLSEMIARSNVLFGALGAALRDTGSGMKMRHRWSVIRQMIHRASVFERELLPRYDPERTILYSYWAMDWVTILATMQLAHPEIQFITRIHGFDLYEHLEGSLIGFRDLQFRGARKIFPVSQAGLRYLVAHYPRYRSKFELSRLGTLDHGPAPWSQSDRLRLVSVSTVIPLKRVHMIAEALKAVQRPVHWTHFGGGPGLHALTALAKCLPAHIQWELRGRVANEELTRWYQTHQVDAFLHASSSEGVPVSMMEASSFGIPIIAIDAGGVSEIVNDRTGWLLPAGTNAAQIASFLDAFEDLALMTTKFREGVRAYWRDHYAAKVNHNAFCDRLLELWADIERI